MGLLDITFAILDLRIRYLFWILMQLVLYTSFVGHVKRGRLTRSARQRANNNVHSLAGGIFAIIELLLPAHRRVDFPHGREGPLRVPREPRRVEEVAGRKRRRCLRPRRAVQRRAQRRRRAHQVAAKGFQDGQGP